jgi:hypothetical protein
MCDMSGGMMMCPPHAEGGKAAFLLISIALGYWVLTLAENQGNFLKLIGRIMGWLVMLVALSGLICSAAMGVCRMRSCQKDPHGMMMGHGMAGMKGCPMGMEEGDSEKASPAPKK